ncbi:MAG: SusC/RagA family TonB-linked outer membrane protein [Cyclobacteriaceae bacterium]|nr:SusC/RagA family TonB-linked outer membrane protein [Cyclobacteriaceae bacterium]
MKLFLPRVVILMSRYSAIGFFIICVLNNTVFASEGKAQKYVSVYETYIDTDLKNMDLEEVFKKIEALTDYTFSYHRSDVDPDLKMNRNFGKATVADVLMDISRIAKLQFKQVNNNISVKKSPITAKKQEKLEVIINDLLVTGKVTDSSGEALVGVSIILKGSGTGTITDQNGRFTIEVPENSTLVLSYIGYKTSEISVGSRTVIDVRLEEDIEQLSEIVVTALGVEKQSRELGYGVSSIKAEDLLVARESNIVNALQGKVTGVNIQQTGGNLGGSVKVVIRGVTSLSGRNNPLWVVDGVPINDDQSVSSNSSSRIQGNRDFANGASVINPDDVESMSVLKGAAASALYGSRAAAGVILVTTKKGKASKAGGPAVVVSSSYRFDQIFKVPDYQNEYSAGNFSKYDSSSFSNWGARITGQIVPDAITDELIPLRAYEDNYKDFYRTGKTMINNVNVSDANDKADYRLSITSLNQTGILPNAELDRITTSFNAGMKHSEKLQSRFSVQYINTKSKGTGASGSNDPNVIGATIFTRTHDFKKFTPWIDESGNQINAVGDFENNPFWIRYENRNERKDQRFIGRFEATYKPITALGVTARVGYDYDGDNRLITNRNGTVGFAAGDFLVDGIQRTQLNTDLIATYFTSITSDLAFNVMGGFGYNKRIYQKDQLFSQGLSIPNLFNPSNALSNAPSRSFSEYVLFGAYGEASLSYKNWATLSLTGRNDWSSTLPKDARSYFYPSASLAVVLTEALGIESNIVSYGKLRASLAQVGNDTNPYQLLFTFNPESYASGQYNSRVNFPFDGRLGFSASTTIPPENLRPEGQTTVELGAEVNFINNRIRLDVAYFNSSNIDQIIAVGIPQSTGKSRKMLNIGEVTSKGVELSLDADVIKTTNLKWNSMINFTHNESIVKSLAEGSERLTIASEFSSNAIIATPGHSFQLNTTSYLRDSISGRPIINHLTGLRQVGPAINHGSVMPNFSFGFINTITYKSFSLSSTIDGRVGGKLSSGTVRNLWNEGATKLTAENREGTFIDRTGVLDNGDGTFRDNDIPTRSAEVFWKSIDDSSIAEASIFDATFVKLREVAITYQVPMRLLGKSFFKGFQVGLEGRNLMLLYTKVPDIDPEANSFGSGADGFGIERNAVPSTRSLGFNVRLTF